MNPDCLASEGDGVTLTLIFGSSHPTGKGSLARVPSPPLLTSLRPIPEQSLPPSSPSSSLD